MRSPSLRRLISLLSTGALVATLMVATSPAAALAAAPPAPYFNGFDNAGDAITGVTADTQAMFNVTRAASGTSGITSADGAWHAQALPDSGAFTRYGGYSSTFPVGGYTTSIDIYLDMTLANGANDLRFDWSSAVTDQAGAHLRDFIFNVGTDPSTANQFIVSASNNAPGHPAGGVDPLTLATSGWYTFQHTFRDNGSGALAVDMRVIDPANAVLRTWIRSDPGDTIATVVGGNRYGWLVNNAMPLALDNITRSATVSVCSPTGLVRDTINLTAALIDPVGPVTGPVDATGCNIGVYYGPDTSGSVIGANIFGANYYGVVVNAAAVDVTNASIHDIGESPLNGSQHGVGVLYTTIDQAGATTGTSATGTLSDTTITSYQKNGVVISGSGAVVTLNGNTVAGEGEVNYIAQNGIQVSFGASARLFDNNVSLNNYTPAKVTACGLLIYKAGGVSGATKSGISYIKADNNFHNNETNICNFGKGGGFTPAS